MFLKTNQITPLLESEILKIKEGCKIWKKIKVEISKYIVPEITGLEIEKKIESLFLHYKVKPAFKNYNNFPGLICISINDCIVHGAPNNYKLKIGDKITLDIGFKYKEFYIDSAFTEIVGDVDGEYKDFILETKKAMWAGINAIKNNSYTGHISAAIEKYVKKNINKKYKILEKFSGHGIGKKLHDFPPIFNSGLKIGQGVKLIPNSIICIEPMLLEQEDGSFKIGENTFDVMTKKKMAQCCHWEHMILIKKNGIEILTADKNEIQKYYEK